MPLHLMLSWLSYYFSFGKNFWWWKSFRVGNRFSSWYHKEIISPYYQLGRMVRVFVHVFFALILKQHTISIHVTQNLFVPLIWNFQCSCIITVLMWKIFETIICLVFQILTFFLTWYFAGRSCALNSWREKSKALCGNH